MGADRRGGGARTEVPGRGQVTLWPPVWQGGDADDEESWIDEHVRELAKRGREGGRGVACATRTWSKRDGTRCRPQDVMILVKRRGELASLLVVAAACGGRAGRGRRPAAAQHAAGGAGPARGDPLRAAARGRPQPRDAAGVAADRLDAGRADGGRGPARVPVSCGGICRTTQTADAAGAARRDAGAGRHRDARISCWRRLLSGPLDGRRKLLERLGDEARDPIEELLNAALTFESTTTPSLQRFLDWFDRGEVEIVRDPSAPLDAVRVMTAHGAKGLQAPLVILADACIDPTQSPRSVVEWAHDGAAPPLPIFAPRKGEGGGPLDAAVEAVKARELEEHWRLFYVAATRAEEQLVIAGSLGTRAKGVPYPQSWYTVAAQALTALGVAESEGERVYRGRGRAGAASARLAPATLPRRHGAAARTGHALPAPLEARPPRPLAPSALGDDAVADPPPTPAMRAGAERGRLMHALFERLPGSRPTSRAAAADRWLRETGGVADAAARAEIVAAVLAVIGDPAVAEMFGPDVLAEAPLTAVVDDGLVVAGTVDRLLVTPDRVRVVDFKTGRRVPATLDEVPPYPPAPDGGLCGGARRAVPRPRDRGGAAVYGRAGAVRPAARAACRAQARLCGRGAKLGACVVGQAHARDYIVGKKEFIMATKQITDASFATDVLQSDKPCWSISGRNGAGRAR